MTTEETLEALEALGDAKRRKHNDKYGAGDNQVNRGREAGSSTKGAAKARRMR